MRIRTRYREAMSACRGSLIASTQIPHATIPDKPCSQSSSAGCLLIIWRTNQSSTSSPVVRSAARPVRSYPNTCRCWPWSARSDACISRVRTPASTHANQAAGFDSISCPILSRLFSRRKPVSSSLSSLVSHRYAADSQIVLLAPVRDRPPDDADLSGDCIPTLAGAYQPHDRFLRWVTLGWFGHDGPFAARREVSTKPDQLHQRASDPARLRDGRVAQLV
jgi:hypothetical protein